MVVGVLHDTIEVAKVPTEYLYGLFNAEITSSLICLTRLPDEDYENYVQRIARNELARQVKLADLEDNLAISKLEEMTKEDLCKYVKAYKYLKGEENGK